jgi:hypothetical protein
MKLRVKSEKSLRIKSGIRSAIFLRERLNLLGHNLVGFRRGEVNTRPGHNDSRLSLKLTLVAQPDVVCNCFALRGLLSGDELFTSKKGNAPFPLLSEQPVVFKSFEACDLEAVVQKILKVIEPDLWGDVRLVKPIEIDIVDVPKTKLRRHVSLI